MPKIKTKSQLRLYHPEKKRLRLLNLIIQNFNSFWGSYGGMMTFEDNYLETLRELEAFSTKEEIDTFEKALASHIAKMYIPSLQIVYESEVHKITEIEDYMLEHNFFVRLPFSLENHILFYILKRIEIWKTRNGVKAKQWQRFARDSQNIHTAAVSTKMNDSLKLLLDQEVPTGQKTTEEIIKAFSENAETRNNLVELYKDMKDWGTRDEIFVEGDYLYRKTLRGLWAKIKTFEGEMKKELIKRLWEETTESIGLCATGHIARLTNVLVGYDEAFKPQISKQETLQNRIAQISMLETTEDEKIQKAKKVMDELNIPEEERQPWLDAF
jgi:hypothetical protein